MAERLEIVITADARNAVAGFNRVETATKQASSKMTTASRTASRSIGMIGTAAAAAGVIIATKAVKEAVNFDRAMSEVWTITNLNEKQLRNLTSAVEDMSVKMGVDATGQARALYQTISAGVTDTEQAMRVLQVATKASIGGLTSQEVAVDALTTVLNAYGASADQAENMSDLLFTTVRLGKTRFEELAGTIGQVVPLAASADVGFEQVAAAMAALTKHGLSTDIAATALRGTFQALLKPTKEVTKLAAQHNIELGMTALRGKGLSGILDTLAELYEKDREAVTKLFPNVRALVGVLSLLTNNSKDYTDALEEMRESQGATTEAFDKMNKSSARQFELFHARLNQALRDTGEALLPAVTSGMEGLSRVLPTISKNVSDNAEAWEAFGEGVGIAVEGLSTLVSWMTTAGDYLGRGMFWLAKRHPAMTELRRGEALTESLTAQLAARRRGEVAPGTKVEFRYAPTYEGTPDPLKRRLEPSRFREAITTG